MDLVINYSLRRLSTGTIVGILATSLEEAEKQAQELAYVNSEPLAVVENVIFAEGSASRNAMSVVGATGVLVRLA